MEPIKEVSFERVYNAPIERVWEAWTNPEILKHWWGPDNASITECDLDLRVGGKFLIVMEAGEDMTEYTGIHWPMLAEYTVVQPNSKLEYKAQAWTEGQKEETLIDQETRLELQEMGDKTKLKLKAFVSKTGPNAKMAVEGMQYGFSQQLEKLNKILTA